MLHQLLTEHHAVLIDRCRVGVARSPASVTWESEFDSGLPVFLQQLIGVLRRGQVSEFGGIGKQSPASETAPAASTEIAPSLARLHARALLARGGRIEQAVHNYGNLRQAITALAAEKQASIALDELQALNRCLDNAIADAVAEFAYRREVALADHALHAVNERIGSLAHDLRNHINVAMLAIAARKISEREAAGGSSGAVLDRSLTGMRNLVDRSLAEVRATAKTAPCRERVRVADLVADIQSAMTLESQARDCKFAVSPVDPRLAVDVERDMLFAAIGNLLQNAFKFTQRGTEVSMTAHAASNRVLIDVADRCGGLPGGDTEAMFRAFKQVGTDRTGLGLGLAIARRSVEANDGRITARDVPGYGCVFTVDLPCHAMP